MRVLAFILLVSISLHALSQQPLPGIGLWREHLPYNHAIDLTTNNDKVFCATPYSLFTVKLADESIERFSRITGLSETGISAINYDSATEKLLIAYNNSNLDILFKNDVHNIPDIKRANITGDKTIYNIFSYQTKFYLATGLGVVVVDAERYEVKDSWFIGDGGQHVKVNGFTTDGIYFYAATEQGLKRTAVNGTNPADYLNWQTISGNNGLPTGPCQNVLNVQGKTIVQKNDSLFAEVNNVWTFLYTDGWTFININASGGKITICERQASSQNRLLILNADGTIDRSIIQPVISFPRKAILINSQPWLADQNTGLTRFSTSAYEQYIPNSPASIAKGDLIVRNSIFYGTAGEVDAAWNALHNANGFFMFKEGEWTNVNSSRFPQLDSLLDQITIAIDPADGSAWVGSFSGGLLHLKTDQSLEIFKQNLIGPATADPGSYRVSGLAFDQDNNLWIANYGAAKPLIARKKDGSFVKYSPPFLFSENSLSQVIIDDNNYKWIVVSKTGSLICFDHGNSIDNANDDKWKLFGQGAGNGNLPSGEVLCVAKDKSGFIWVGTSNGIGVIQCGADVFSGTGCDAIWPIVQQGNFAGYLFNGEEVRSIAVDGADRKWIATEHGAWLISADGEKVIYNFTEENSPLLSNDIRKIAIDGTTGEVYFATANGICSFRSTATEGTDVNENVLVFPNPVPPGFNGTIGIRGLAENAIVKITEMDGRLVYQTRALGGQAVWDGHDYKGRKISSGVYLVLVSGEGDSKKEKTAGKIVFIGR